MGLPSDKKVGRGEEKGTEKTKTAKDMRYQTRARTFEMPSDWMPEKPSHFIIDGVEFLLTPSQVSALFEPIPESEDNPEKCSQCNRDFERGENQFPKLLCQACNRDKPTDPDSVTVRRSDLRNVLCWLAYNGHLVDDCSHAYLRAALGEKAEPKPCEHIRTERCDVGVRCLNGDCGMVRTLGPWHKPEQK